MPDANLDALRPDLEAIEPNDVVAPDKPISVALQEANDLATLVAQSAVRETLVRVGLAAELLDRLPRVVDATRAAQSDWVVARDRTKPETQREREERAYGLRSDILAACRWSLRHDRVGLATADAIAEGEGVEDLIQDLRDLHGLLCSRLTAFAADQTFDAAARADQARALAEEVEQGLSRSRLSTDQSAAKGLRDRAYTYLAECVGIVRAAGRYAYRDESEMRRRFASEYLRRKRRRAAGRAAAPATPTAPTA